MNKSELIAKVAEELELPKTRVAQVANALFDTVVGQVAAGETVGITVLVPSPAAIVLSVTAATRRPATHW